MLVEINLIKKNEKKNRAPLILFGSIILFIFLGSAFLYLQTYQLNGKLQSINQQVEMSNKLVETLEQKKITVENNTAANELKNTVEWANDFPISSVFVLKHLTTMLPERGYILSFKYTDEGKIEVQTQFENKREAAYYLASLRGSEYVNEAFLLKLTTDPMELLADESLSEQEKKEILDQYVPRYIGAFIIDLDKKELRLEKEGEENVPS